MDKQYEIIFHADDYVKTTYKLDSELKTTVRFPADIPYNGIVIARRHEDGTTQSYFKADAGLPFEETLAQKLLSDPNVKIGTRHGFAGEQFEAITDYILPCRNPDSIVFAPTIYQPISNACNVQSEFAIEVLFTFDDGYMFPVIKEFKTGGSFSINVMDAMNDIISELESSDIFSEFLSDCPNVYQDDEGWHIIVSSPDGLLDTLDFEETPTDEGEVRRAVTSMRLVRLKETIE